ncbi:endolytic transglycosylase MltG [Spongiibacter nanhainus]|uniref:Endolytic murein transglycosylase n=1 Tax=Spongiibacter nanhainus TaxID=2794344 RepID=A0A7T4USX3_9GAMM|nr:endolytic transglycosylase MltG [Spongiibacter nanhainus]QQD19880.1 endolytic transglycosylase MltG [Spongiibacter nanhainus]
MLKFLFKCSVAIVFPVVLVLLSSAAYVTSVLNKPLQLNDNEVIFILPPGTGFSTAINQAETDGWLDDSTALKIYGRLFPGAAQIRAGEYRLLQGITIGEWLTKMREGQVVRRKLTLVEGWRLSEVLRLLNQHALLDGEIIGDGPELWQQLQIESPLAASPEGLMFPDTYDFQRGDSPESILRRAYQRMLAVLDEEWQTRAVGLPYESPYEALIMASIIEKETGVAAERGTIAGVFVRRLQKGMLLQTDPTIIYGLGESFDGNLRSRHLRDDDNPYNTYAHRGLPPTPIALAGREAIHAALHPEPGDALYFVARGDGSHQFSATLAEHEAAVRQYQLQRRKDYRSAPQ